jgi:tripartite-type tricarboxylate transporter receptor subunit TctC
MTAWMTALPRGMLLALALWPASAERAAAQATDYPARPVTFIVPFAPGGVTSLFARLLGQKLEQRLASRSWSTIVPAAAE